jgi:hypothetical protein
MFRSPSLCYEFCFQGQPSRPPDVHGTNSKKESSRVILQFKIVTKTSVNGIQKYEEASLSDQTSGCQSIVLWSQDSFP